MITLLINSYLFMFVLVRIASVWENHDAQVKNIVQEDYNSRQVFIYFWSTNLSIHKPSVA